MEEEVGRAEFTLTHCWEGITAQTLLNVVVSRFSPTYRDYPANDVRFSDIIIVLHASSLKSCVSTCILCGVRPCQGGCGQETRNRAKKPQ